MYLSIENPSIKNRKLETIKLTLGIESKLIVSRHCTGQNGSGGNKQMNRAHPLSSNSQKSIWNIHIKISNFRREKE